MLPMLTLETSASGRQEASSSRRLVLGLALILCALALYRCRAFYHDDAYITLRYVTRLLAGQGLTWNPGEQVEGFTHPLWLLQVSALGALGVDLVRATQLLGCGYLLGLLLLFLRSAAWSPPLLLLATLPGLILWAVGGLELLGFSFWLLLGAALCASPGDEDLPLDLRAALAGLAFAAATLTRPEGLAVGLCALALRALRRRSTAPLLLGGAALLGPVGAYLIFRVSYFGDLLPNPARAKVDGLPLALQIRDGLAYLRYGAREYLPATIAALLLLMLRRAPRQPSGAAAAPWPLRLLREAALLPALASLPLWAGVVATGGDHMPGMRFAAPAVALLVLAAGRCGPPTFGAHRALGLLAIVAAALMQLGVTVLRPEERSWSASLGEPVGRFFEGHLPGGSLVAVATAGATPFFAPSLRFIDSLGLTDPVIARRRLGQLSTRWQALPGHRKGDGAYLLRRAPDVIVLGPTLGYLGEDPRAWFLGDEELLRSAEFRAQYRPYRFAVPVLPHQLAWPAVRHHLQGGADGPTLPLVAYLRVRSERVAGLLAAGQPLTPPWAAKAPPAPGW